MRVLRMALPVLALVILIGLVIFFVGRGRATAADYGPLVAYCPGPDYYGYVCEPGAGYAYFAAANDSLLYADDELITLPLPFPFTFYGAEYRELHVSSNGNIQFTTRNAAYANQCLTEGPVAGMGDMIAPFWDDLDLTFAGHARYETVGNAPNRIFVIEWVDAPPFSRPQDTFTFAAQLFEGSNDIVLLYPDVTAVQGHNGRLATIGLQSERLGISLQYGCNQPAVADGAALRFTHPETPNAAVEPAASFVLTDPVAAGAKGDLALLLETVNRQGAAGLPALNRRWLNETTPRSSQWLWGDMSGDGRDELIWLWQSRGRAPHFTGAAILGQTEDGQMAPRLFVRLSDRAATRTGLQLQGGDDLTGDGRADFILHDPAAGEIWLATAVESQISLLPLALTCRGEVRLLENRLVLNGCGGKARQVYQWDGRQFQPVD
jgi:hypothetical protein